MSKNGYVSFPIALTAQYDTAALRAAIAEYNERPASDRWGEERIHGYSAHPGMSTHLDRTKQILENICVTEEKSGFTITAEETSRLPVALLARDYGHEFTIRGIGTRSSNGQTVLETIISIDLVKTKELFTPEQVVGKVLGWATDRKILTNGKVSSQVSKYYEEAGELAAGICKTKHPLIVDSIGDALVVITNVLGVAKCDLRPHLRVVLDEAEAADGVLLSDDPHELLAMHMVSVSKVLDHFRNHSGKMAERLAKYDLKTALMCLSDLAYVYSTSIDVCMSDAWNEIKDRRGYLNSDGVFIKEADAV